MVEVEPSVIGLLFALGVTLGVFIGYTTAVRVYERKARERKGRA